MVTNYVKWYKKRLGLRISNSPRCLLLAFWLLCYGNMAYGATDVALVIWNSQYKESISSANTDDISLVVDRLKSSGFKVYFKENLNSYQFSKVVKQYMKDSQNADLSLIYYHGHAIHLNANFLVPVDVRLRSRGDRKKLINLHKLKNDGDQSQILILDACRHSSMALGWGEALNRQYLCDKKVFESSNIGKTTRVLLTNTDPANSDKHSFSRVLANNLQEGKNWQTILKEASGDIARTSSGKLKPVLFGNSDLSSILTKTDIPDIELPVGCDELESDEEIERSWAFVIQENKVAAFNLFVDQYPCSIYIHEAKILLGKLNIRANPNQDKPNKEPPPSKVSNETATPTPLSESRVNETDTPKQKKLIPFIVASKPKNAIIKILTIKEKYYPGIKLEAGKPYQIEISKDGYQRTRKWITLTPSTQKLSVSLKKSAFSQAEINTFTAQINSIDKLLQATNTTQLDKLLPSSKQKRILLSVSEQYVRIETTIITNEADTTANVLSATIRLDKMIKQNGEYVFPPESYRNFVFRYRLDELGIRNVEL